MGIVILLAVFGIIALGSKPGGLIILFIIAALYILNQSGNDSGDRK